MCRRIGPVAVLAAVLAAWPTAADDGSGGGSGESVPAPISDVGNMVFSPYAVASPSPNGSSRDDLKSIRVTAAPPVGFIPSPHPYETAGFDHDAALRARQADVIFAWEPPNMSHRGVYFEDLPVERYGQSFAPVAQPVVSYFRFVGAAAFLPYRMGVDPPRRMDYDVGLARPGSPTPPLREHLPFSLRGVVNQAAATTGAVFFVHP